MNKAIFLDKDGTLIKDVPYNVNPLLIKLEPFVAETLAKLRKRNYMLIVVSNQSGVAKGLFDEKDLTAVNDTIQKLLSEHKISIDDFYYCPHHSEAVVEQYKLDCNCRKPKAGLIWRAAKDHNIDLKQSWMIGDILNDVEAGKKARCKTILINNGNETEWILNEKRTPHFIVKNMKEVEAIIP